MRATLDGVGDAEAAQPGSEGPASTAPQPSVAVIVVNLDGAHHLPACLDSLAAQDYPQELMSVAVVDNGSTDGSLQLLASQYPWVRVLEQETNLGFAPAVDIGVRALDSECVALLNNDMRVAPDWLTELVRLHDPTGGVPCVGGQILSWDGETVDFAQAGINLIGMGVQVGFGLPRGSLEVQDGQDLLFACGGAMLVHRATYLSTGGFDPDFFAYFEDVDFGWRLWVQGYRVRLAAKALSYHRHHGTSARFPEHQRTLLLERNALRSMIKNYDDEQLKATLGPSLLLLAERAINRGGLERAPYDMGADEAETEVTPRVVLAHLHAIGDVVADLPQLMDQRRQIQRARRRSDGEIFERFGRPFDPPIADDGYLEAQDKVIDAFGLDHHFERRPAKQLLVVVDHLDDETTQLATMRAIEIARSLGRLVDVKLAAPAPSGVPPDEVVVDAYENEDELRAMANGADVVLGHARTFERHPSIARASAVLVADLSDVPMVEASDTGGWRQADEAPGRGVVSLNDVLDRWDFFICASERQRDYWLGLLSARDRLDDGPGGSATLRDLIDVVPFGFRCRPLRPELPQEDHGLEGHGSATSGHGHVVLWVGGVEAWSDPMTVMEAFLTVVQEVPGAKLCFPGPADRDGATGYLSRRLRERAEDLGLLGTSIIFGQAEDQTRAWLQQADLAVGAAMDLPRAGLRGLMPVLDALQAGVPVVVTERDLLCDFVKAEGVGIAVEAQDVAEMSGALIELLSQPAVRAEYSSRARALAAGGAPSRVTAPLERVIAAPWRWRAVRDSRRRARVVTDDIRILLDRRVQEARLYRREVQDLRAYVSHLEATVEEKERRLELLRKTPVYPLFKAAKRTKRWVERRGS